MRLDAGGLQPVWCDRRGVPVTWSVLFPNSRGSSSIKATAKPGRALYIQVQDDRFRVWPRQAARARLVPGCLSSLPVHATVSCSGELTEENSGGRPRRLSGRPQVTFQVLNPIPSRDQ